MDAGGEEESGVLKIYGLVFIRCRRRVCRVFSAPFNQANLEKAVRPSKLVSQLTPKLPRTNGCNRPIVLKKAVSSPFARAQPKKCKIDASLGEIWSNSGPGFGSDFNVSRLLARAKIEVGLFQHNRP